MKGLILIRLKNMYALLWIIGIFLFLNVKDERKSEQAHIPHAPTLLENAVYNEGQFQALGMSNQPKNGI